MSASVSLLSLSDWTTCSAIISMALWPSSEEDLTSLSVSVLDTVVLVDDDLVLLEALLLLTTELLPGDSGVLP